MAETPYAASTARADEQTKAAELETPAPARTAGKTMGADRNRSHFVSVYTALHNSVAALRCGCGTGLAWLTLRYLAMNHDLKSHRRGGTALRCKELKDALRDSRT